MVPCPYYHPIIQDKSAKPDFINATNKPNSSNSELFSLEGIFPLTKNGECKAESFIPLLILMDGWIVVMPDVGRTDSCLVYVWFATRHRMSPVVIDGK